MAALAVVRDLREHWAPVSAEELERFETDVLSGFVLARASAGLADGTIRGDVGHLDQIRSWFGRPLWDMGDDALRSGLKDAAKAHLPGWGETLTPHVLRHFCASQLYGNGLDLLAIQEVLGHSWIATTMRYIHVQQTRVEDAWVAGTERAAKRLEGLVR